MAKEVDIVRWRFNGEDAFPQTHADGVVDLDEYIDNYILGEDTGWLLIDTGNMNKPSNFIYGFDSSYRVKNGMLTIRLNIQNVTDDSVIKLPPQLMRYPQEMMVNTSKLPIQINIQVDGNIYFNTTKYNKDWSSDDYVYQELYFYVD